jgi:hypothetical protein
MRALKNLSEEDRWATIAVQEMLIGAQKNCSTDEMQQKNRYLNNETL